MVQTTFRQSSFSAVRLTTEHPVIIYRGSFLNRINRLVNERQLVNVTLHPVDSWNEMLHAIDMSGAALLAIDDNEYRKLCRKEKERFATLCEQRYIPLIIIGAIQEVVNNNQEYCGISEAISFDMIDALVVEKIKDQLSERERSLELAVVKSELENTRKRLDDYVYIISHDFKAPLRGLASLTDFIAEELSGISLSKEAQELLVMIKSRADFMQRMVDDLLHFSRITSRNYDKEQVDVKYLINSVLSENPCMDGVRLSYPDNLPFVFCEKIKLHEIFFQLIKNGVEFNDSVERAIEISFIDSSDELEFIIQDNGRGIKAEHHHRIFGLFQQLNSKDHSNGTGIGLPIVKSIIEQQKGRVWIESTYGLGTQVHFTWRK